MVCGSELIVDGLWFMVYDSRVRVQGAACKRSRVQGLGLYSGSEAGSHSRFIDLCITQLQT